MILSAEPLRHPHPRPSPHTGKAAAQWWGRGSVLTPAGIRVYFGGKKYITQPRATAMPTNSANDFKP